MPGCTVQLGTHLSSSCDHNPLFLFLRDTFSRPPDGKGICASHNTVLVDSLSFPLINLSALQKCTTLVNASSKTICPPSQNLSQCRNFVYGLQKNHCLACFQRTVISQKYVKRKSDFDRAQGMKCFPILSLSSFSVCLFFFIGQVWSNKF